eukprot:243278_1
MENWFHLPLSLEVGDGHKCQSLSIPYRVNECWVVEALIGTKYFRIVNLNDIMESEYGWDYYYFVNNSTAASSSAKSAVQSYLKPIQHQFKNGDICIMANPTEIVAEHNGQLVEVIEIDEFGYELGGVQQPTVKIWVGIGSTFGPHSYICSHFERILCIKRTTHYVEICANGLCHGYTIIHQLQSKA